MDSTTVATTTNHQPMPTSSTVTSGLSKSAALVAALLIIAHDEDGEPEPVLRKLIMLSSPRKPAENRPRHSSVDTVVDLERSRGRRNAVAIAANALCSETKSRDAQALAINMVGG